MSGAPASKRPVVPAERRRLILELLREQGSVSVSAVEERFGVSPMTASVISRCSPRATTRGAFTVRLVSDWLPNGHASVVSPDASRGGDRDDDGVLPKRPMEAVDAERPDRCRDR
jgi:hypothetical protein